MCEADTAWNELPDVANMFMECVIGMFIRPSLYQVTKIHLNRTWKQVGRCIRDEFNLCLHNTRQASCLQTKHLGWPV
jgi:hypothetical protein